MASKRRAPPPTESLHPASEGLDRLSSAEIVRLLHREDLRAARSVGRVLRDVARAADAAHRALASGGRLIYVGAGTSGRLGALDAAECPPTFGARPGQVVALIAGGPGALRRAVEGAEDDEAAGARDLRRARVGRRDLVVGISASAATPYVRAALREAKAAGARTVLVSSNPGRRERRLAEVVVAPDTGPELVAGSTRLKAGTATKLVLNAISTAAFVRLGTVYRGRMVALRPTNAKLRARAERTVAALAGVSLPRARSLLAEAGQSPKLALAIAATGLRAPEAAAALERGGLRALERLVTTGPKRRPPRRGAR